jgi:hypothetical protein
MHPEHKYETNTALYMTLWPIVRKHTTWKFVAANFYSSMRSANVYVASQFNIYCSGEYLGTVELEYHGRGYKIAVRNDRIADERERGSSYRTEDVEKATTKIRRKFYPKGSAERVDEAVERAASKVREHASSIGNETYQKRRTFLSNAEAFVLAHSAEYTTMFNLHKEAEALAKAQEEKDVVDVVHKAFLNGAGAIVLVDGLLYIVKVGKADAVTRSDSELSEDMRAKLGMLKLVEDGEIVSGVGLKVDEKTFFLVGETQ